MTMRLSIDLPASLDEVRAFIDGAEILGFDEANFDEATHSIVVAGPIHAPERPSDQPKAKAPSKPKAKAASWPKARAASKPGELSNPAKAVLVYLARHGRHQGTSGELCAKAWPSSPHNAANHIAALDKHGLITTERLGGHRITAVEITAQGHQAVGAAEPSHLRPAPVAAPPAAGLATPAGGWG